MGNSNFTAGSFDAKQIKGNLLVLLILKPHLLQLSQNRTLSTTTASARAALVKCGRLTESVKDNPLL